jgi:hypothetical protein
MKKDKEDCFHFEEEEKAAPWLQIFVISLAIFYLIAIVSM